MWCILARTEGYRGHGRVPGVSGALEDCKRPTPGREARGAKGLTLDPSHAARSLTGGSYRSGVPLQELPSSNSFSESPDQRKLIRLLSFLDLEKPCAQSRAQSLQRLVRSAAGTVIRSCAIALLAVVAVAYLLTAELSLMVSTGSSRRQPDKIPFISRPSSSSISRLPRRAGRIGTDALAHELAPGR